MFEQYPKTRPPLPQAIQDIYASQYKANRDGATNAASLAQKMEAWLHRRVADDLVDGTAGQKTATLELGAGTLNQLAYEPASPAYDIVEPFTSLFEGSPLLARVREVYADIAAVPVSQRYDRITSIAVLEHVCNLPELVARAGLLLADGGSFRASIPSEGTLLWTLGWRLTTGLEFRLRHGLDYGLLMKHEHVNTAHEIETVLAYFFDQVQCQVFGLNKAISFYRFYDCKHPNLDRCRYYLQSL
jgi:hypothetical protein